VNKFSRENSQDKCQTSETTEHWKKDDGLRSIVLALILNSALHNYNIGVNRRIDITNS